MNFLLLFCRSHLTDSSLVSSKNFDPVGWGGEAGGGVVGKRGGGWERSQKRRNRCDISHRSLLIRLPFTTQFHSLWANQMRKIDWTWNTKCDIFCLNSLTFYLKFGHHSFCFRDFILRLVNYNVTTYNSVTNRKRCFMRMLTHWLAYALNVEAIAISDSICCCVCWSAEWMKKREESLEPAGWLSYHNGALIVCKFEGTPIELRISVLTAVCLRHEFFVTLKMYPAILKQKVVPVRAMVFKFLAS